MKKVLLFLTVVFAISVSQVSAQQGPPSPEQMIEMMKQRVKPSLIEKTKITDAQADKVIETMVWSQGQMRGMRDLSPEEREKKMKEVAEERTKKFKAIPLTEDQVKAVNQYLDEMRNNRGPRG
ncbi:MAG: hypothetical protein ACRC0I_01690 [Sediminibacterium sp.]|jgi:hypothetical protein|nr:hypothetical protein [Chitinophagaceae bacterium]MCA6448416.1 hypothetical protein [Chitinophagaceae bacterium]